MKNPVHHPSGWRGGHHFRRGHAWSGCGEFFLSVNEDVKGAVSYNGEFLKYPERTACRICRAFVAGFREAEKEMR